MTKRPTPQNLTPLLEDSSQSPFMRELLEAGRGASVAGYDFEQGLSKHLALIDAGAPLPHWAEGLKPAAGSAGTGGAAAAAAGSGLIAWIAVPLALVAVSSAVLLVANQSPAPAPVAVQGSASAGSPAATNAPQPASPKAVAPIVVTPDPVTARPVHPATSAAPHGAHGKRLVPMAPSKPLQAPVAQSGASHAETASAKSAAPATSGELFATAQPAVATTPTAQTAAPVQAQEKPQAQPEQAARAPEPPQAPAQDDARLEREMSMLAVAQRALQSDPERALSLARQGEAEFSGSMFTQERQQVVLLALVKLGRMDEARRLAKPYLARYPHGPFSERVRHALATGKVER